MAKKQKKGVQLQLTPESYIKTRARTLEIDRCYVNSNWKEEGMANVIVVRRHPKGTLTVGGYLVDTFCLGVKDCFYKFSIDEDELEESILRPLQMAYGSILREIDYATAHNIVYGAMEYALDLALNPHEDWAIAKYILEEDNDDVPLIEFEFGKNGRPLLCAKSNLEASLYMTILDKSVGRGNYDVIIKDDDFDDDEFDDEDFLDDDRYEEEITDFILDSVDDMSDAQAELYHALAFVYANRSQDVSKEMKTYADLVFKDEVTAAEVRNAHVDAVISLEDTIKAYRNGEEFDADRMAHTMTFIAYAQVTCELINDMSDDETRKYLSTNENIMDFLHRCDEEVERRAERLKKTM